MASNTISSVSAPIQTWTTSTPVAQATTAQWPTSYEQYYNYYNIQQAANPTQQVAATVPTTTASATTVTTASTIDYNKAWDEYYKAYYGQNYAAMAANQYQNYSYDQYAAYAQQGYYPTTTTTTPTATTEANVDYSAYSSQAANYGYQIATTNWNQPPPDYTQTTNQAYSQAPSQSNEYNSYGQTQETTSSYANYGYDYDKSQQADYSYDQNDQKDSTYSKPKATSNQPEKSYTEMYPPPQFDSKPSRGRGQNKPRPSYPSFKSDDGNEPINGRGRGTNVQNGVGRPIRPVKLMDIRPSFNTQPVNKPRQSSWNEQSSYDDDDDRQNNQFSRGRGGFNSQSQRFGGSKSTQSPEQSFIQDLLKLNVIPSIHSQVITRRQESIDDWSSKVAHLPDVPDFKLLDNLQRILSPEMQGMFMLKTYINNGVHFCEMTLEDVFITYGTGPSENDAKISAAKSCRSMLSGSVSVIPISRQCDGDYVPGFCITTDPSSVPQLPAIYRSDMQYNDNFETSWGSNQKEKWGCDEDEFSGNRNNSWANVSESSWGNKKDLPKGNINETGRKKDFPERSQDISHTKEWGFSKNPSNEDFTSVKEKWDYDEDNNDESWDESKKETETWGFSQGDNSPWGKDESKTIKESKWGSATENKSNVKVPINKPVTQVDTDIFIIHDDSSTERDPNIATLQSTAKFNDVVLEFKHEKKPQAPHISVCVITLGGKEIGRYEARDYLVAKRQAAEKALSDLKQIKNVVGFRLDQGRFVLKSELPPFGTLYEKIKTYLNNYLKESNDVPLRFGSDFNAQEKATLMSIVQELSLSHKSESMYTYVYREYPILETKNKLLNSGVCGQYKLIEKVVEQ